MYILKCANQRFKPIVKYSSYAQHFNEHFKISFGRPRVDTCQMCDSLENRIATEQNAEVKNVLKLEKELHVRKAATFYDELRQDTAIAKNDSNTEVLTFDYQQNFPLPHIPAGDVFYKRQLGEYNFCVTSGKQGNLFLYV